MGLHAPLRKAVPQFPQRWTCVLCVVIQQPQRCPCSTIPPLCTIMSGPSSQDTANPLVRTCIPLAFLPFPSAPWQQAAEPSLPMRGHFRVCLGQLEGLSILLLPPRPPTASCKCAKGWRIEPAPSILVAVPGCRMMVERRLGGTQCFTCPSSVCHCLCYLSHRLFPAPTREKKSGHRGLRGSTRNMEQIRFLLPLPKAAPAWESQGQGRPCVSPATADSRVGRWQQQWWLEHCPWRALQPASESPWLPLFLHVASWSSCLASSLWASLHHGKKT